MGTFDDCAKINELLQAGDGFEARNNLIKMLDGHGKAGISYDPLVNHLIRESGLFPYLDPETSSWRDRFAYESFKIDVGQHAPIVMHSEQSLVLKHLLDGVSLAISAPTSFGKSLIIDAFIAIKRPVNVLILVPTIALTDETRRRLNGKFSKEYKIITTADVELGEKNILIFPQERAVNYCGKLKSIDLLVVDEFYKASQDFDKERSASLLKAMIKLGAIALQKYYLAPNISSLNDNPFTRGMRFLRFDFNTVFLEKYELYKTIGNDAQKKNAALIEILEGGVKKSLIYAGTYSNVELISNLLLEQTADVSSSLLIDFSNWLALNYHPSWMLTSLVKRGAGIHTGQLHRSLSQIQVKLFEEEHGLRTLVSTSSIIEGVNTSAENVVVWSNKNGILRLNDFTYKNIIGRGGRMFRHFVGNIYLLEKPPVPADASLNLTLPDDLLASIDEVEFKRELTGDQVAKIILYKEQMSNILGKDVLERLLKDGLLISGDMSLLTNIAVEISQGVEKWRGLAVLNYSSSDYWGWILHKVLRLLPGGWDVGYTKFVEYVKILSGNWANSISEILDQLDSHDVTIEEIFKMERTATFKLAALLSDINVLQREIMPEKNIDISLFIARVSRAFLPSCVMELEEYGLPRMLSKKIHATGLINFEDENLSLHMALDILCQAKSNGNLDLNMFDNFDKYVLDHFFQGIEKSAGN